MVKAQLASKVISAANFEEVMDLADDVYATVNKSNGQVAGLKAKDTGGEDEPALSVDAFNRRGGG